MATKFTDEKQRDEFAQRLFNVAGQMKRAWDQGHNGSIIVNETMIEDIEAAGVVVATADLSE